MVSDAINPTLHVRYDGRSFDLDLNDLDIGIHSTDEQVKNAMANYLDIPIAKLSHFAVDRNESTGALTLRPEAVFG